MWIVRNAGCLQLQCGRRYDGIRHWNAVLLPQESRLFGDLPIKIRDTEITLQEFSEDLQFHGPQIPKLVCTLHRP
jgi:hypothetical protein